MRILWLVNIEIPEFFSVLGIETKIFTGSWLISMLNELKKVENVNLSVVFPSTKVKDIKSVQIDNVNYFAFPKIYRRKLNNVNYAIRKYSNYFYKILDITNPDIIHIHGTEEPHSFAMAKISEERKIPFVLSVQSILNSLVKHYTGSLQLNDLKPNLLDIIFRKSVHYNIKVISKLAMLEKETYSLAKFIIGRTTYDEAFSRILSPKSIYFHCNELLRPEFYQFNYIWNINKCERNSIFLTQATHPLKGLHIVLEAINLLRKDFNNVKLYVSGPKILEKSFINYSPYERYIFKFIKLNNLYENIKFLGILDAEEIIKQYLKTHVFVSSSSIENESNSLSEAKFLGVPSVVSYVGGTTDRIIHGVDGFHYQHDSPYMLAYYISKIFSNDELAEKLSENARINALKTNNIEKNILKLLNIYFEIISTKK